MKQKKTERKTKNISSTESTEDQNS